jgi:hypothetical protein
MYEYQGLSDENWPIDIIVTLGSNSIVRGSSGKVASSGTTVVADSVPKISESITQKIPQIGSKLDYLFGKATGRQHNIDRTLGNLNQMEKIGLFDTPANREYIIEHLNKVINDPTNIIKQEGYKTVRESLLMGPNGGVKMKTFWDGTELKTFEIY